jgi:hypothetical protein
VAEEIADKPGPALQALFRDFNVTVYPQRSGDIVKLMSCFAVFEIVSAASLLSWDSHSEELITTGCELGDAGRTEARAKRARRRRTRAVWQPSSAATGTIGTCSKDTTSPTRGSSSR